jgi:hypothetical protein
LLHDVGELVGHRPVVARTFASDDVVADGVRPCLESFGRGRCVRAVVDPNVGEVGSEGLRHPDRESRIERPAFAGDGIDLVEVAHQRGDGGVAGRPLKMAELGRFEPGRPREIGGMQRPDLDRVDWSRLGPAPRRRDFRLLVRV